MTTDNSTTENAKPLPTREAIEKAHRFISESQMALLGMHELFDEMINRDLSLEGQQLVFLQAALEGVFVRLDNSSESLGQLVHNNFVGY